MVSDAFVSPSSAVSGVPVVSDVVVSPSSVVAVSDGVFSDSDVNVLCQSFSFSNKREDSDVLKVSVRELKEQVLSPDESSVGVVRIARQARSEKGQNIFAIFRQGENEVVFAGVARWDEQLRM